MAYYTLTGNWSDGFTLKGTDGIEENFGSDGKLASVVDNDGNTTYYTGHYGWFHDLRQRPNDGRNIDDGLVYTITDFADRSSTLDYDDGLLTSITLPSPTGSGTGPETVFGNTVVATPLYYTALDINAGRGRKYDGLLLRYR